MAVYLTLPPQQAEKALAGKTVTILSVESDERAVVMKLACQDVNYMIALDKDAIAQEMTPEVR